MLLTQHSARHPTTQPHTQHQISQEPDHPARPDSQPTQNWRLHTEQSKTTTQNHGALKSQTKPPDTQPNPIRQCLQACNCWSMVSSSLLLLLTSITHTPRPVTQRETQRELATKPPTLPPKHPTTAHSSIVRANHPHNTRSQYPRCCCLQACSFTRWFSENFPFSRGGYLLPSHCGATACQFSDARLTPCALA